MTSGATASKGFKDVRVRLCLAAAVEAFSFLCGQDIADKMERVIAVNDGRTIAKERHGNDTLMVVEKT